MKASLIISVYKNITDLKVVLDALAFQTEKGFEIIISEDGCDAGMSDFLKNYQSSYQIIHLSQPDEGWRKNRALNRAIAAANTNYLIFIDGDCVLHHRFIENHLRLALPKGIVAGKRIKLGPRFSNQLRQTGLLNFENKIIPNLLGLFRDGAKFVEEGLFISPTGFWNFIAKKRSMRWLKGCNFSCFKEALIAINGFDEDYCKPAVGEDADLAWRFKGLGYYLISARNYAVQYHLYHQENWTDQEENLNLMRIKQAQNTFRCLNGIEKIGIRK